jgi:hypothetical protein
MLLFQAHLRPGKSVPRILFQVFTTEADKNAGASQLEEVTLEIQICSARSPRTQFEIRRAVFAYNAAV